MTSEFKEMVSLLRHSVFGDKTTTDGNVSNIENVLEISFRQGVFPLVYGALSKEQKLGMDPKWEQLFFKAMIKNEQKSVSLSTIIKKLEQENISYCILKGCTVATDYYLSECRLSGDIDLYVKPEFEEKTSNLLKSMGFEVEPRPAGKQDFKAYSAASGVIEVHVQLYADDFCHIVLADMFGITEEFVDIKVNDFLSVKALGPNDTLEFLTTHFIKHFVREGSGIRQVTDLLAFVNKHKDEIDFDRYFERLEKVNFKKLILNIFGIGVKYFDLDFEFYSTDMIQEIMDDVEAGENFGFGESERQGFYEKFLQKKCVSKNPKEERMLAKRKRRAIFKSVFLPTIQELEKKGYNYLRKTAILYPVAYVHRLWDVFFAIVSKKRNIRKDMSYAQASNDVIDERLDMMKKLDIIQ